jgi:hypothetical protein
VRLSRGQSAASASGRPTFHPSLFIQSSFLFQCRHIQMKFVLFCVVFSLHPHFDAYQHLSHYSVCSPAGDSPGTTPGPCCVSTLRCLVPETTDHICLSLPCFLLMVESILALWSLLAAQQGRCCPRPLAGSAPAAFTCSVEPATIPHIVHQSQALPQALLRPPDQLLCSSGCTDFSSAHLLLKPCSAWQAVTVCTGDQTRLDKGIST